MGISEPRHKWRCMTLHCTSGTVPFQLTEFQFAEFQFLRLCIKCYQAPKPINLSLSVVNWFRSLIALLLCSLSIQNHAPSTSLPSAHLVHHHRHLIRRISLLTLYLSITLSLTLTISLTRSRLVNGIRQIEIRRNERTPVAQCNMLMSLSIT